MRMLNNTFLIIILVFSLSAYRVAQAQQAGEELTKHKVTINNNSTKDISFQLGEDASSMQVFIIRKHEEWFSKNYSSDPIIKLQTRKQQVSYSLSRGKCYNIVADKSKKFWDV